MAENGYGPVTGHLGRIPNFGKSQPMGSVEPPACIQNAMMTKDKKPFTYTPGGLDLSQIRTPSMARRMARQRSLEEQEQANQGPNNNYHPQGGPAPPPPPPPQMPVPPPPPPLVIAAPNAKSPKPVAQGERPEIVIPENPIGMLRKTNSPYHWEAEKADLQRMGPVPKFVEKVPSPLTVKMPTQQPPQNFSPQIQNNIQRQNYPYKQNSPGSPLHRPEAQYAHQQSASPNVNGSPPTRDILVRQDSQFNKSPQPFGNQSPQNNASPYSPSPNNSWRQPERRDSPANSVHSPQSPQSNRGTFTPNAQQYSPNAQQFSPNIQQYTPNYQNQTPPANTGPVFHTLPRAGLRNQDNNAQNNNVIYNNTAPNPIVDSAPWRTATLNRCPRESDHQQQTTYQNSPNVTQQQPYNPPWKAENTPADNAFIPSWKQDNNKNINQQYTPPWVSQDSNNNKVQENCTPWRNQSTDRQVPTSPPKQQEQPRYQSTMSIPVTPRKHNPQPDANNVPHKEVVYVNQEPVYFCPDSPNSVPPWVKTQKEKTKTPPPVWCQKPLEGRRSIPRELATPPRDANQEPEWVKKSNEMQRGAREVVSPPKYQQPVQPTWSTRPSENRKSLPKDAPGSPGSRIIPIQMEVSSTETRNQGRQGNQQPQLRIVIDMQQNPNDQGPAQAPYSQPTQRIMRVLSPQLVRLDDGPAQSELPSLNRNFQSIDGQPKTRIIPIQVEGGNGGANKSPKVYYHKFTQEGPPRQSKAFKVLQIITGTQDIDHIQDMEINHGFTDL